MKDALDQLPPLRLEALFASLLGDPAPRVTLRLDSGHAVTGDLLAFADGQILLRDLGTGGGLDATYVPLAAVRAATVHYGRSNVHVAARGRLPAMPDHVPTRLELKRQAAALPLPVQVDWEGWPATDLGCVRLGAALTELATVLRDLAEDPLGAEALGGLEGVHLGVGGEGPDVRVAEGRLVVQGRLDGEDVQTPGDLRAAVEKAL